MPRPKILILAREGITTRMLYNGLPLTVEKKIILESPESKGIILKRRIKKLGFIQTFGQVLFMLCIYPFIAKKKERVAQLLKQSNLSSNPISTNLVSSITSIHAPQLSQIIAAFNPDLIIINGTRILPKQLIASIHCPLVNIHVGITPHYRGVHGGYWALKEKNPHLYGVTLHYVDVGIDTGKSIAQRVLVPGREDNFNTYPIQQYAAGIALLNEHLDQLISGKTFNPPILTTKSKLHYHPTIYRYFFG